MSYESQTAALKDVSSLLETEVFEASLTRLGTIQTVLVPTLVLNDYEAKRPCPTPKKIPVDCAYDGLTDDI